MYMTKQTKLKVACLTIALMWVGTQFGGMGFVSMTEQNQQKHDQATITGTRPAAPHDVVLGLLGNRFEQSDPLAIEVSVISQETLASPAGSFHAFAKATLDKPLLLHRDYLADEYARFDAGIIPLGDVGASSSASLARLSGKSKLPQPPGMIVKVPNRAAPLAGQGNFGSEIAAMMGQGSKHAFRQLGFAPATDVSHCGQIPLGPTNEQAEDASAVAVPNPVAWWAGLLMLTGLGLRRRQVA